MSNYNIDFAPEKLSTFNTLLKYGKIAFWLFIEEHINTRRKKLQFATLRKDRDIYPKHSLGSYLFLINNSKKATEDHKQGYSYGLKSGRSPT